MGVTQCFAFTQKKYMSRYKIKSELREEEISKILLVEDRIEKHLKILKNELIPIDIKQSYLQHLSGIIFLSHANLIKIYDYYVDEYQKGNNNNIYNICIAMEYVQQVSLVEILYNSSAQQILTIFKQLKSTINYLLKQKFIKNNCLLLEDILIDKTSRKTKIKPKFILPSHKNKFIFPYDVNIKNSLIIQSKTSKPIKFNTLNRYLYVLLIQLATKQSLIQLTTHFQFFQIIQASEKIIAQIFQKYLVNQSLQQTIRDLLKVDLYFIQQEHLIQNIKSNNLLNIVELNLSNCLINDQFSQYLKKCEQLEKLNLCGTQITDHFIKGIENLLPHIIKLSLALTNITDQSLFVISKYEKIQYLDLSYTNITQKGISQISKLPNLKQLLLWQNYQFSNQQYEQSILLKSRANYMKFKYPQSFQINQSIIGDLLRRTDFKTLSMDISLIPKFFQKTRISESTRIEIIGKIEQDVTQHILSLNSLQTIFLKDIDINNKRFKSNLLSSVSLINCRLQINQLINSLEMSSKSLIKLELPQSQINSLECTLITNNFPNLSTLNLNQNNIGNSGTIQISKKLIHLKILSLKSNNIRDQGLNQMKNLTELISLDLSFNNFESNISFLSALQNLIFLNLSFNNIGNIIAQQLMRAKLNNLTVLNLQSCKVKDRGAIEIATLINLISLNLSWNKLRNEELKLITHKLQNLKVLQLIDNDLNNDGLIQFCNLKHLEILNLWNNDINDQGVKIITTNLKKLVSLNLSWNNITNIGVVEISTNLTLLKNLYLSHNSIQNAGAVAIASYLTKLIILDLSENLIENEGAIQIATQLQQLKQLNISNNNIDDLYKLRVQEMMKTTQIAI